MRQEADQKRMGCHEHDRRRDRLSLDLERGDPEGEVRRQDRANEGHERGIPSLDSQQRGRLPEGSAPYQNRRTDDPGGECEPVQGDGDWRRLAPRDEDRGERDGEDRQGDCRIRSASHARSRVRAYLTPAPFTEAVAPAAGPSRAGGGTPPASVGAPRRTPRWRPPP